MTSTVAASLPIDIVSCTNGCRHSFLTAAVDQAFRQSFLNPLAYYQSPGCSGEYETL